MTSLSQFVNNKFGQIVRLLHIFNPNLEQKIFDYKRMRHLPKGKETYNGYDSCGPTSYILSQFIQTQFPEHDLHVVYSARGYGKHLEDHAYLEFDKRTIIDPTYKQFLVDPLCEGDSEYSNYLYSHLPPFFVGSQDELMEIIHNLRKMNPRALDDPSLTRWWTDRTIIKPFELDLSRCLNDPEYASKKPNHIQKVVAEMLANN